MKKEEPSRTCLYLFSHQPLFLLLCLTFSKIRPEMFKYSFISKCLAISKCATMSEWQLSSTLASISLLADYPSVKLTSKNVIKAAEHCKCLTSIQNLPKAFFDLSCLVQKVKFLPDNDTFSYVICLANTTNKANIYKFTMRCKQVIRNVLAAELYAMAHGFDIKKQHWGRYQIVWAKSYLHSHTEWVELTSIK